MLLRILATLVLALLPGAIAAPALADRGPVPAVNPVTESTAPVALDLVAMTPTALHPTESLTLRVRVTNQGEETLEDLDVRLRAPVQRITSRTDLQQWQSRVSPHTGSPVRARSASVAVPAGESTELTVTVPASQLRFGDDPSLWGARRISVTAHAEDRALASLRTFTVWWPDRASEAMVQPLRSSVLMPVWTPAPGQSLLDPDDFAARSAQGRLATVRALTQRENADWVLDPSLLTPPRRLKVTTADPADGQKTDAQPTDTQGSAGGDSPTNDGQDDDQSSTGGNGTGAGAGDGAGGASDGGGDDAATEDEAEASASAPPTEFVVQPDAAAVRDQLRGGVDGRTVLGLPYARADLAAVQDAGQERLLRQARMFTDRSWREAGTRPRSEVAMIPGERATPDAVVAAHQAGADAVILPQGSVRADPNSGVLPSGATRIALEDGTAMTAITPDPSLSRELSAISASTDVEQSRQRMLAETAVLAGANLPSRRHVVMMPSLDDSASAEGISQVLDAVEQAPWVSPEHVGSLLDAVEDGTTTKNAVDTEGRVFAIDEVQVRDVHPSALAQDGTIEKTTAPDPPTALRPELLDSLDTTLGGLLEQTQAMEDPAAVEAPLTLALAAVSDQNRTDQARQDALAAAARRGMSRVREQIRITPASGYNLVSGSAGVPITVSNSLGTSIHVTVHARTDRQVARFGEPVTLTVPAYSQEDATIPVEAVANGSVELTTTLTAEGSTTPLVDPVTVPLTVNPAWENWTTMAIVAAMGVLVVVGIFRARRVGSERRAPAELGPEPTPSEERARTTNEETR